MNARKARQKAKKRERLGLEARRSEPEAAQTELGRDVDSSHWWRYLRPSARAKALATGGGLAQRAKTQSEVRLELLAVKKRWPIPEDLKASLVYEAASLVLSPSATPKDKINATRLLAAMEQMNQRDDNPDQMSLTVMNGDQVLNVNAVDMLNEMRSDWSRNQIDERPYIPTGSDDDYAE